MPPHSKTRRRYQPSIVRKSRIRQLGTMGLQGEVEGRLVVFENWTFQSKIGHVKKSAYRAGRITNLLTHILLRVGSRRISQ